MNKKIFPRKFVNIFIAGMALGIVVASAFGAYFVIEKSYRQGQIDALRGDIHYEKVESGRNSTAWVRRNH